MKSSYGFILVVLAHVLVACAPAPKSSAPEEHSQEDNSMRSNLLKRSTACYEGVEYIVLLSSHAANATPAYNPDGSIRTCK